MSDRMSDRILQIKNLVAEYERLEPSYEIAYEEMKTFEDGIEGCEKPYIENFDEYNLYGRPSKDGSWGGWSVASGCGQCPQPHNVLTDN